MTAGVRFRFITFFRHRFARMSGNEYSKRGEANNAATGPGSGSEEARWALLRP
jgi:hypothetical protein